MKRSLIGLCVLACLALPLRAEPISKDVYKLMHLDTKDVLTGPILTSRVLPGMAGDPKQVVALVTYMTGKHEEANAVNVRLEVMRKEGEGGLASLYARDFGKENGGFVGHGDRRSCGATGCARHARGVTEVGPRRRWQDDAAADPARGRTSIPRGRGTSAGAGAA